MLSKFCTRSSAESRGTAVILEHLADYGDSDDDSFSYSCDKRQCCSAAPLPVSSACITEDKDKGEIMHCKSVEEASSSNSSWSSIKSRFIEMGYSTTTVEKAIEECGLENENSILEHILNNQVSEESLSDSSCCSVRTHFVSMGYSSTLVDKAMKECGTENETAILEFLLNYQEVPCASSSSSINSYFVRMGYSSSIVDKAIEECGTDNETAILESILTYQALENISHDEDSLTKSYSSDNEDMVEDVDDTAAYDGQFYEGGKDTDCSQEFDIKGHLLEMGFEAAEVSSAIERFGLNIPVHILIDSIYAVRFSNTDGIEDIEDPNNQLPLKNKRLKEIEQKVHSRKLHEKGQFEAANRASMESVMSSNQNILLSPTSSIKRASLKKHDIIERVSSKHVPLRDEKMILQSPRFQKKLLGFGVPGYPVGQCQRQLNMFAEGPPYFYFENVASTPKGVWETISRFLYDIEPEFVDAKYFSVSSRKRGYVHNLPIENRFRLMPLPPLTIHEAFPDTRKYWPSWDYRTKLNCINTVVGSAPLCERMRSIIKGSHGKPSIKDQARVLYHSKKWNLVWVGPDQLAPLEPHEMELALGFDIGHTRGSSTRTERVRSLGNAFQTDTVAYHLSVLKNLYPNGINVLSLFSGIGGAEVALHRLGITLKYVVSAEICKENRLILRSWWEKTRQNGELIELEDVQSLTDKKLEELNDIVGGFDLIIGGSPCNNLTGSNRCTRDGLEGKHSSLFFEFPRIVNVVRHVMRSKGASKKRNVL